MNTYTGKELVELLQGEGDTEISLRTIRHYTSIDLLPKCEVGENNKLIYTEEHLKRLRSIRALKKTGQTLSDIKGKMNSLSLQEFSVAGEQMQTYMTRNIFESTTIPCNEQISITFRNDVNQETKDKVLQAIEDILKGEL